MPSTRKVSQSRSLGLPLPQRASPHAQGDGPALTVIHGIITLNTEALNIEQQLNAHSIDLNIETQRAIKYAVCRVGGSDD